MNTNQIRKLFLDYFAEKQHKVVPSASLVPMNDPTLLFTNAGMVQFKEVFLGIEHRSYSRAASAQRCVRAGGKHNDLENVGHTNRHHTFFEMLGNFSFGDYFKYEAIQMAWDLVTNVFKIPKERLWVTVFREDKESERIWLDKIKISPERFSRCGEKDNFWSMGDTGPCGPCTEIFYDHGPGVQGSAPGTAQAEGDRYVEIWNLVFMQYNRDINGQFAPLPKPSVDTGMGLERIAAVLQGVHDNYAIDLFQFLLKKLSALIHYPDMTDVSMRVIVDHIRSSAFLIMDRVMPSNEGRGYVLRRIIRRALRHGFKLGQHEPFFYQLTGPLVEVMGGAYPELIKSQPLIEQVIYQEEQQFCSTLEKGLKILGNEINQLSGKQLPGSLVFTLYDTYGFPPDLTADIAREKGLTIDHSGFEAAMEKQRQLSQRYQQFNVDQTLHLNIVGETEFTGYQAMTDYGWITTLLFQQNPVSQLTTGQSGVIVLDRTPFYAESGGQIGDSGYLSSDTGQFRVKNTIRRGQVYLHYGEVVSGKVLANTQVKAQVDESRQAIVLNHSATHLLHEALRRVLGEHVIQKGSLVEAKRLRFDFSHPKALTAGELSAVDALVNEQIRANLESSVHSMSLDEAKEKGALALFEEKYREEVRVVKLGEFSMETCGGTHVHRTGDIGFFKILSESACAAGIRRIEAVTGQEALNWVLHQQHCVQEAGQLLKVTSEQMLGKLTQVLEEQKYLIKEIADLKHKLAISHTAALREQAQSIHGVHVIAEKVEATNVEVLRGALDAIKRAFSDKKGLVVVLGAETRGKVLLVASVSKDCIQRLTAVELLNFVAEKVDGKGGGRPDMAQGGGQRPENLKPALEAVFDWVGDRITGSE